MSKKSRSCISILFITLISSPGLFCQANPGDAWLVAPGKVNYNNRFTVELHINSGAQAVAAYGVTLTYDSFFSR